MSLLINLGEVSDGERSRAWHHAIRDHYLDLDIRMKSDRQPSGMIAQSHIGSITFAAMASVSQTHERTETLMNDDVDHLVGWLQFKGRAHLDQYGRESDLNPGSFLLLDSSEPYRAEFRDDYQIFVIKIPRIFFQGAFVSKKDFVNVRVDEHQGSMIIVDYFRRMAAGFAGLTSEHRARMSAHGVRMMVDTVTAGIS